MARPILTLTEAAHEQDQAEGEATHDRAHLDGDELLGPHRAGQARLEQIGVHAVDVARRVQARQAVAQAASPPDRTSGSPAASAPARALDRLGVRLGLRAERADEVELVATRCERQAAAPTPTRPMAIKVMPTSGTIICRVHVNQSPFVLRP